MKKVWELLLRYSPYLLSGMVLLALIWLNGNQDDPAISPPAPAPQPALVELEKEVHTYADSTTKTSSADQDRRVRLVDLEKEVYYYAESNKALIADQDGMVTLKTASDTGAIRVKIDIVRALDPNGDWEDEVFPKAVFGYKNLRFLGIGMRGFKTIPAGISQLKYLEEIDFQHGSIETLPDDFCQLRNLRNAIFLFSNLKELPECIGDLENLEYLHLGHTYITRFPESMKNLKKLKIVLIQQSPDKPHISESEYLKLKSWLPKCGIHYELRNVD